jgi:hypothetical protein
MEIFTSVLIQNIHIICSFGFAMKVSLNNNIILVSLFRRFIFFSSHPSLHYFMAFGNISFTTFLICCNNIANTLLSHTTFTLSIVLQIIIQTCFLQHVCAHLLFLQYIFWFLRFIVTLQLHPHLHTVCHSRLI